MNVGDKVFVGYPLHHDEPRGFVYQAVVVAVEGGRMVVRSDHGGLNTVGEEWSAGRAFGTEGEAWSHCAEVLRARAAAIVAAAAKCEAEVVTAMVEA